ncbi:hypothetical protein B0J17DRAFT_18338 [Rhizoctonia solani]|nr:hypothetical protein B0J17DRAFT_18338 [Rhizoctonia solani]
MSPEFFEEESQHEPLTTQLDIWSLGCTFLEVLTGRLPYNRYKSNTEILEQILTDVPPDLDESFDSPREAFSESYVESIKKLAKQCWLPAPARPLPWELYDKLSPLIVHAAESAPGSGSVSPTLSSNTSEDDDFGLEELRKGIDTGRITSAIFTRVYIPSMSSYYQDQLNNWCDRVRVNHVRFSITQTAYRDQNGLSMFQATPICRF